MRKLSLHFAIIVRQKTKEYNQIQEEIRNLQRQERHLGKKSSTVSLEDQIKKYLEKKIEYRKLRKFSNSEKISSQEKSTVYREHL
jgi:hypothetical protein